MNLNMVQVCGRMVRPIEMRQTASGLMVGNFSVATNFKFAKKDTNEKVEEVEFHNVVAFGRTAEVISQYFAKGDEIYIVGRLKTSSWEDKNGGGKRYKTEIIAEKFEFGQKAKANGGADYSQPAAADDGVQEPADDIDVSSIEM